MYDLTISNEVALNDWLSTINKGSPESTYQGSYDVPFQRWFKFKEAFSPLLVKRLIEESPIPVTNCLDVFGWLRHNWCNKCLSWSTANCYSKLIHF